MVSSKMVKSIIDDMNKTITELRCKELLRDERGISQNTLNGNLVEISFNGKNFANNIVFDKHITSSKIIDTLLGSKQYTLLLYDKGIIQAEYLIKGNEIVRERLVFIKKHNKIWDMKEIEDYEAHEEDWFEEKGIPIMFRIDYAPDEHKECEHPKTHLTISNHESCRIPMKGIVTFSEFIRFVLFHFYNIKLNVKIFRLNNSDTITELEKQMIHINWK